MARPSVEQERRAEIFDAAARCVVKFGLSRLTLEKIAEEAGMSRGHIRHFVGNRDDLIVGLAAWMHERNAEASDEGSGAALAIDEMFEYLYGDEFSEPGDENTVILELLTASRSNAELRAAMLGGYNQTREAIRTALADRFPRLPAAEVSDASYSFLALALGNAVMSDLDQAADYDPIVKASAVDLLTRLAQKEAAFID